MNGGKIMVEYELIFSETFDRKLAKLKKKDLLFQFKNRIPLHPYLLLLRLKRQHDL